MGRELGIHRIDFLKDGTAVVRHSDYNLCGRTDFTGDITRLFYNFDNKEICYLLISKEHRKPNDPYYIEDTKTIHVKVEDNYWDEQEFDMDYGFVYREVIQEIVNENMGKDERLLGEVCAKLEDARKARQHSANLEVFENFSDLIEDLNSYILDFNKEAEDYISEIIEIEDDIKHKSSDDIIDSYVLLTYSE